MKTKILLGHGLLSWPRCERVSDRYGVVSLYNENADDQKFIDNAKVEVEAIRTHEGKVGKIVCEILDTRQSVHIGDLFHGYYPQTPDKGEKIELGKGELFYERINGVDCVGVKGKYTKFEHWMNPKKLYRAHEQTVNLFFIPKPPKS